MHTAAAVGRFRERAIYGSRPQGYTHALAGDASAHVVVSKRIHTPLARPCCTICKKQLCASASCEDQFLGDQFATLRVTWQLHDRMPGVTAA